MNKEEIQRSAAESNRKLYEKYPQGCEEYEAREFFAEEPYPSVAWAILTSYPEDVAKEIDSILENNK